MLNRGKGKDNIYHINGYILSSSISIGYNATIFDIYYFSELIQIILIYDIFESLIYIFIYLLI